MRNEDCVLEASTRIGAAGGVLTIDSRTSPIARARITVPAGALEAETGIAVSHCRREIKVAAGRASGVYLLLQSDGAQAFDGPVLIEISYRAGFGQPMVVPYRIEDDGSLAVAQIQVLDKPARRLTIATFRPGLFTWVFA